MDWNVTVILSLDALMAGDDHVYNVILQEAVRDFRQSESRLDGCSVLPLVVSEMNASEIDVEGNVVIQAVAVLHLE